MAVLWSLTSMLSQLLTAPRTRTKRGGCESFLLKYEGALVTDKHVIPQLLTAPRTSTKRGGCESFPLKYEGALVTADKHVITAAHCTKDKNKKR
jgi:hypothetical protein